MSHFSLVGHAGNLAFCPMSFTKDIPMTQNEVLIANRILHFWAIYETIGPLTQTNASVIFKRPSKFSLFVQL